MPLAGISTGGPPLYANQDGYNTISLTNTAVTLGSKTFTIQPSKAYGIGNTVKAYNVATGNWLIGDVTAHDPVAGILTINATGRNGIGSYAQWNISLTGPQGEAGVNASGTGGGAISTGDLALTVSSGVNVVNPTSPGFYATLPNAILMANKTMTGFTIINQSDFDYGIKDNTGKKLGWIRPRGKCNISCADNTSDAGVWGIDGIEYTGVTAQVFNILENPTKGATMDITGQQNAKYTLDNGRELLIYDKSNGMKICIYDSNVKTFTYWGVPTGASTLTHCRVNNNQIMTVSSNGILIRIRHFGVDPITGVLSIVASADFTAAAAPMSYSGAGSGAWLTRVGTLNSYVFAYSTATNGTPPTLLAFTSTGGVITVGSETNAGGGQYDGYHYKRLYSLNNATVVMVWLGNSTVITARAFSLSGVSLTGGIAVNSDVSSIGGHLSIGKFFDQLPDGRIPIGTLDVNGAPYVELYTVTGTTITRNKSAVLTSGVTPNSIDLWPITSSKFYTLLTGSGNGIGTISLLTTSGTTINIASTVSFDAYTSASVGGKGSIIYADDTTIRAAYGSACVRIAVNGTTLVVNDAIAAPSEKCYAPYAISKYGYRDFRVLVDGKKNVYNFQALTDGIAIPSPFGYIFGGSTITLTTPIGILASSGFNSGLVTEMTETWVAANGYLQKLECVN